MQIWTITKVYYGVVVSVDHEGTWHKRCLAVLFCVSHLKELEKRLELLSKW